MCIYLIIFNLSTFRAFYFSINKFCTKIISISCYNLRLTVLYENHSLLYVYFKQQDTKNKSNEILYLKTDDYNLIIKHKVNI